MSEPRTRVSEGATPFERELLQSWHSERPSARARRRALGLVGGAAVGATSTTAAAGAVMGAPKVGVLGVAALKWLAVGSVVAIGAVAAAPHLVGRASPSSPAVVSTRPVAAPLPPPPAVPAEVRAQAETSSREVTPASASTLPVAPPPDVARSSSALVAQRPTPAPVIAVQPPTEPTPSETAAHPPPASSLPVQGRSSRALGDQVAAIDRARAALAAGDARESLHQVDDYEARFPRGGLLQEAAVLRVEALVKMGDRPRALEVGSRFLEAYPTSPHAARVRQMLRVVDIP